MKIFKNILIVLLVLVVIAFAVALVMPKDYVVSHKVTINKPKELVYQYLGDFKNQTKWSAWNEADPNAKIIYSGKPGTVGHSSSWNGNDDMGEGTQTITKVTADRMDVDLHFVRPMEDDQKASTIIKAIDANSCEVIQEFYGSSEFPFNIMNFIGKKIIGDAFVKNGENLKKVLEQ